VRSLGKPRSSRSRSDTDGGWNERVLTPSAPGTTPAGRLACAPLSRSTRLSSQWLAGFDRTIGFARSGTESVADGLPTGASHPTPFPTAIVRYAGGPGAERQRPPPNPPPWTALVETARHAQKLPDAEGNIRRHRPRRRATPPPGHAVPPTWCSPVAWRSRSASSLIPDIDEIELFVRQ
jgi:hypothetical protein